MTHTVYLLIVCIVTALDTMMRVCEEVNEWCYLKKTFPKTSPRAQVF